MARPSRTPAQRLHDRTKIGGLVLKGWSIRQMAAQIGRSKDVVFDDLKHIAEEWRKEAIMDFDAAKARELAKINCLEMTYWRAWENSEQQARRRTRKTTTPGKGRAKVLANMVENTETFGDPRYLAGVQWCIERRIKLLGLDVPAFVPPEVQDGPVLAPQQQVAVVFLPAFSEARTPPQAIDVSSEKS